jgi:hypothetical protein
MGAIPSSKQSQHDPTCVWKITFVAGREWTEKIGVKDQLRNQIFKRKIVWN